MALFEVQFIWNLVGNLGLDYLFLFHRTMIRKEIETFSIFKIKKFVIFISFSNFSMERSPVLFIIKNKKQQKYMKNNHIQ